MDSDSPPLTLRRAVRIERSIPGKTLRVLGGGATRAGAPSLSAFVVR